MKASDFPIGCHVRIKLDVHRVGDYFFDAYAGKESVVLQHRGDMLDVALDSGVTSFELDEVERGRIVRVFVPDGMNSQGALMLFDVFTTDGSGSSKRR